ncbi:MAG: hypothetical protein ACOX5I_00065 [Gleimia sp.]|nr:hypothetical protein [Acidobacteriota bacterium]
MVEDEKTGPDSEEDLDVDSAGNQGKANQDGELPRLIPKIKSIDLSNFMAPSVRTMKAIQTPVRGIALDSYPSVLAKVLAENKNTRDIVNRSLNSVRSPARLYLGNSTLRIADALGQNESIRSITSAALRSAVSPANLALQGFQQSWPLATLKFWGSIPPNPLATSAVTLGQLLSKQQKLIQGIDSGYYPDLFKKFYKSREARSLPQNLRPIYFDLDQNQVQDIFLPFIKEGRIPAFGIPRSSTLMKLIHAEPSERRNVMWSHRKSIVADCNQWISNDEVQELVPEAEFASDALTAIQNDNYPSAQTLLSTVLDDLTEQLLAHNPQIRKSVKNYDPSKGEGIPDFLKEQYSANEISRMEDLITWLPICRAFEPFHPGNGKTVPRHYNRHASAHKAKKKQLVKRNAIQALMLTTSLIDYICVRTKREQLDRLSGRINNPLHSS